MWAAGSLYQAVQQSHISAICGLWDFINILSVDKLAHQQALGIIKLRPWRLAWSLHDERDACMIVYMPEIFPLIC